MRLSSYCIIFAQCDKDFFHNILTPPYGLPECNLSWEDMGDKLKEQNSLFIVDKYDNSSGYNQCSCNKIISKSRHSLLIVSIYCSEH